MEVECLNLDKVVFLEDLYHVKVMVRDHSNVNFVARSLDIVYIPRVVKFLCCFLIKRNKKRLLLNDHHLLEKLRKIVELSEEIDKNILKLR